MPSPSAPPAPSGPTAGSVLLPWMMKAALLGLFFGVTAGILALRAG